MIYKFRFISSEEEDFVIDVNINHDQTFDQLHEAIQEALDYDPSQMASFFISNPEWEKVEEIAIMDIGEDTGIKTMANTTIGDCYSKKEERILYVFDFFSERILFGSLVQMMDAKSPIDLPSVSRLEGKIPVQIATSLLMNDSTQIATDLYEADNLEYNETQLDDLTDLLSDDNEY